MAYCNYRGINGPEVQFTDAEKSKAFVKITKTKVIASYAQIVDFLYASQKFPIGVQPSNYPKDVAAAVYYDPNALTTKKSKKSWVRITKYHAVLSVLTLPKSSACMKPVFNPCRTS